MAELTRLAPEAILRNVMPVFTFMGSNVFHRDDTYSFRVIQKVSRRKRIVWCIADKFCLQTIDMIVPVMADSLRKQYTDRLELYVGARDFLRVFTDAASHIPRHRRVRYSKCHRTDSPLLTQFSTAASSRTCCKCLNLKTSWPQYACC